LSIARTRSDDDVWTYSERADDFGNNGNNNNNNNNNNISLVRSIKALNVKMGLKDLDVCACASVTTVTSVRLGVGSLDKGSQ